jgi:hypothetical protein
MRLRAFFIDLNSRGPECLRTSIYMDFWLEAHFFHVKVAVKLSSGKVFEAFGLAS